MTPLPEEPGTPEDPLAAAPSIPWERGEEPALKRYFATLASAFRPMRSAAAFARTDLVPAQRFFLLSALPFAMLAGVIPHTRTLMFEGNFNVRVLGHPSAFEIALDVARAAGAQATLTVVEFACLALPFASLVRAYAQPERSHAAIRMLFYRVWLMPAAFLIFYLAFYALPAPDPASFEQGPPLGWGLVMSLRYFAPILLILSMTWTARLACGLGPGLSMVVVLVPVLLMMLVDPLANAGITRLLPAMPESNASSAQP